MTTNMAQQRWRFWIDVWAVFYRTLLNYIQIANICIKALACGVCLLGYKAPAGCLTIVITIRHRCDITIIYPR